MLSRKWNERLETLVDDLIGEGSVETSFLASIVMTAQESIRKGDHVALSLRIWSASNDLDETDDEDPLTHSTTRNRLGHRPAV